MKSLVCEMCNSNDLIKQDGMYVCQSCGTKYSPEEAKKMMIEGTVDVSGSKVKLDNSDELSNLYQLARRARDEDNIENAVKYYDLILVKDPNSWEANFFSNYYQALNCKIGEINSAATRVQNSLKNSLSLIKDTINDNVELMAILVLISNKILSLANTMISSAASWYAGIDINVRSHFKGQAISYCLSVATLCFESGDRFYEFFNDKELISDVVVPCWKKGVAAAEATTQLFSNAFVTAKLNPQSREIISGYVQKIRQYEPDFQSSITDSSSSAGCYVATCVYGSYDCPQVWTLRRYRDNTLAETWYGRAFIHTYYAISPTLVKWFGNTKWFKKLWKGKLDRMVAKLNDNGVDNTPYQDKKW